MLLFLIAIGLVCLYQIKLSRFSQIRSGGEGLVCFQDYMAPDKTTSIKGIFVLLILVSHSVNCLQLDGSFLNVLYEKVMRVIGQSVVVMFLFYSGYGVMLSAMKKGRAYVKTIPVRRVARVLFHFVLAVLLFLLVQTLLGERYTLTHILLSLIGWENLGNSNWYIFVILLLYLFSYLAFTVAKSNYKWAVAITFVLTGILTVVLYKTKAYYWWDTAICYPCGMLYVLMQDKVERVFSRHAWAYGASLAGAAVLFAVSWLLRGNAIASILNHVLFLALVLLLTMTVQIHNKILYFFGRHLFSIYILQRLPMLVMLHFGWDQYPYLFVLVSFAVTVPMSVAFDLLLEKADALIFKKKKTLSNG